MAEIKLVWDKKMLLMRKKRFAEAQNYIDNTCVEKMTPFVPVALPRFRNAGKLRDSASIPTPGKIVYTSPKSRSDYYSTVNHRHGGNPQASRLWFEVMKKRSAGQILRGTAKVLGGKKG